MRWRGVVPAEGVALAEGHGVGLGDHGHEVDVRLEASHELDVLPLEPVRGDEVQAHVHQAVVAKRPGLARRVAGLIEVTVELVRHVLCDHVDPRRAVDGVAVAGAVDDGELYGVALVVDAVHLVRVRVRVRVKGEGEGER